MSDRLTLLQEALARFEAGRFAEVAASLDGDTLGDDIAARALRMAARGLALEADGRIDEAMPLVEQAFFADVAIPVLLREIARFFERNSRPVLAHHATLALDVLDPEMLPPQPDRLREGGWARHGPRYVRRQLARSDPMTYPLAPVKAGLVQRLGASAAAVVLAGIADGETERMAARLPLVPLIEHARSSADYAEVIPAEDVVSRRPGVCGGPPPASVTKRTRVLFTSRLQDVVVASRSNVLLAADAALLDVQGDELSRDPVLAVDPVVVARDGEHLFVTGPRDRDAIPRLPEAVWLTGIHSPAFGHWIMEFLPKVWALMERPGFEAVPILLDEGMPPQHDEALRLFVGAEHPIHRLRPNQQVRVDRLWVASQLTYLATGPRPRSGRTRRGRALHPEGFRRLMDGALAALPPTRPDGLPKRVYQTRPPSGRRRLTNADAVEALLTRHGFRPMDFGEIPFIDQLRHVRAAEHIVGQDGSALLMTIFGRPGLRITGLAQPELEEWEWYADACLALGQHLTVIVGELRESHPEYAWMSDYEIDVDALEACLEAVTGEREGGGSLRRLDLVR